jgi:hypothetical protein
MRYANSPVCRYHSLTTNAWHHADTVINTALHTSIKQDKLRTTTWCAVFIYVS